MGQMLKIEWSERFSVGAPKLDEQHKKLFSMINKYSEALEKDEGLQVLGDIIDGLWWYTVNHFRDEEAAMNRASYPDLEEHRKEHKALLATVRKYHELFHQNKRVPAMEFVTFLNNWLMRHISVSDMKYKPYIAPPSEKS